MADNTLCSYFKIYFYDPLNILSSKKNIHINK